MKQTLLPFFALIVCIGHVRANDQVVNDLGDNSGAGQLRKKVADCQSSGGGTVTFSVNGTITLTAGAIPINSTTAAVTIDGANTVVIAGTGSGSQSQLFAVSAGA